MRSKNLVVEGIDQYQEIPSISSYYPAVFPFENEAHDLFGLVYYRHADRL